MNAMPPVLLSLLWLLALPWSPDDGRESAAGLVQAEHLGSFALGLPEPETRARLACPSTTSPRTEWGADGLWHFEISAPGCGVTLGLSSPTRDGPASVEAVTVRAPSRLTSARGIGVGSPEAVARAAYRHELDAEASRPGALLVAGSLYGGLLMHLDRGRVTELFLGAAAE